MYRHFETNSTLSWLPSFTNCLQTFRLRYNEMAVIHNILLICNRNSHEIHFSNCNVLILKTELKTMSPHLNATGSCTIDCRCRFYKL